MPPAPWRDNTIQYHKRLMVFIAPDSDSSPTISDAQPYVNCLEISVGAGDRLPYAILEINLAAMGRRIVNEFVADRMNRQVEVWSLKQILTDEDDDPRDEPLFWGEITSSSMLLDQGERRLLRATVENYHFGGVAIGQKAYNTIDSSPENESGVHYDIEFNPLIDGEVVGNSVTLQGGGGFIWVDPESIRTETAIESLGNTPGEWNLAKIVEALSVGLNISEGHVRNPQYSPDGILSKAPAIKNLILRRGGHLSDYLSHVLPRYGFQWRLDFPASDDRSEIKPAIEIYKRGGGGTVKSIKMQPPGASIDVSKTTCESARVDYLINELSNNVEVHGALIERELTVELYRVWGAEDDGDVSDNDDVNNPVGRKWAANEAGDYKGLREEIPDDPPLLFGEDTVPKRRVIDNCLTLRAGDDGGGRRRPAYVEISDDDGDTWRSISKLEDSSDTYSDFKGYTLLPDEIGIWITTEAIPLKLQETDVENLRMRITGAVRGDTRIYYKTGRDQDSPNSKVVTKFIDASDQFFDRQREDEGDYKSELTGDAFERDDSEAIEAYAEQVLNSARLAQVQAQVTLPGLTREYQIGDIITRIEGREVSFNRLARGAEESAWLQVAGVRWINQEGRQFTELSMEPYDI